MNIVGIRFRTRGQTYYFSAEMEVAVGNSVIVETEQGVGLGEVLSIHDSLPPGMVEGPLSPVVRLASDEDRDLGRENEALARLAHVFCQECIRQRKLEMKLVDVEVYHDRTKIIFYFTAPARIDFRELVKDLVREYRSRIELRQIGVRHETQMVGAVGNCGMVCCCRRFLRKFAPVTIRMAKEQNLFLNPAKISGICGRLLCCLSYEQENYDAFHRNCPRLGKKYQTTQGGMKVLRANMFRNTISVLNENNEELEFTLEDWQTMEPHRPEQPPQPAPPVSQNSPIQPVQPAQAAQLGSQGPSGQPAQPVLSAQPHQAGQPVQVGSQAQSNQSGPSSRSGRPERNSRGDGVQTDNGMLVVTATPETVDELDFDDLEDDIDAGPATGGVFGLSPRQHVGQHVAQNTPGASPNTSPHTGFDGNAGAGGDAESRARRKRKRKPRSDGE